MLKAFCIAGAMAGGLLISPALAALHDGISIAALQAVLAKSGMQTTQMQTQSGTPILRALIPGTEIAILMGGIGCQELATCEGFGAVIWHSQPTTVSLVNRYNQQCCYVRAAVESDGRARLTGEYVAIGGISDDNIIADVQSFVAGMARYTDLRSTGSASLDSEHGSASARAKALADVAKAFTPKELKKYVPQALLPTHEQLFDRWAVGERAD